MISRTFLLVSLCLITSLVRSQEVTKTFIKQGNIYIQYDNADSRQITYKGMDSQTMLSNDKKYVIFIRTIKNPNEPEEGVEYIEESKIVQYTFATSTEKILVQGCKNNGTGSSAISYADSDQFPFSGLCNITNVQLSHDGQRVYFETDAWTTSHAIHYCVVPTGKIALFGSGRINEIFPNGELNVNITGIEVDKGRYTQNWLFDKNGNEIKAIGEKEF
jgi:hypothetical protein